MERVFRGLDELEQRVEQMEKKGVGNDRVMRLMDMGLVGTAVIVIFFVLRKVGISP